MVEMHVTPRPAGPRDPGVHVCPGGPGGHGGPGSPGGPGWQTR